VTPPCAVVMRTARAVPVTSPEKEILMLETNMCRVKEVAKAFLFMDIAETKVPFVASHPFTSSWFWMNPKGELVDLHNVGAAREWREKMKTQIDESDLDSLFAWMNRPYIMSFLKFVEKELSPDDLGMILGRYWQDVEVISLDSVVPGEQIVRMFKRASKNTLMNDKERAVYDSLPDEVTVYRGVTSYNRRAKKALSWTVDKEVAQWFANRFDTGTGEVWTLTVPKERILCFFGGGEKEVIVNLYRADNLKKIVVEKI